MVRTASVNLAVSNAKAGRLRLSGVVWKGGTEGMPVLGPIDLVVKARCFMAILGSRDSGQSTLVKILAGLIPPSSGEIWVDDQRVRRPVEDIGYVPSNPCLLPWRSVFENVMAQVALRGMDVRKSDGRCRMLLAAMELSGHEEACPSEIGEHLWPSVSVCRALVHNPPILLMNEPFGGLDPLIRERADMNLQHLWMAEPRTAILATRSISEAVQLADRVLVLAPRLGSAAQILDIDMPRPRRFDKSTTPQITEHCSRIRNILRAEGVLP